MSRIEVHADLFGDDVLHIQLYVNLISSPSLDVFKEQCSLIPWTQLPVYDSWAPQLLRTIGSLDWDDWEMRLTRSAAHVLVVNDADCTLVLASSRPSSMIPVCCYVLDGDRWLPATASTTGQVTVNDAAVQSRHETVPDIEMQPLPDANTTGWMMVALPGAWLVVAVTRDGGGGSARAEKYWKILMDIARG